MTVSYIRELHSQLRCQPTITACRALGAPLMGCSYVFHDQANLSAHYETQFEALYGQWLDGAIKRQLFPDYRPCFRIIAIYSASRSALLLVRCSVSTSFLMCCGFTGVGFRPVWVRRQAFSLVSCMTQGERLHLFAPVKMGIIMAPTS